MTVAGKPTYGELIQGLSKSTTKLETFMEVVLADIDKLEANQKEQAKTLAEVHTRLSVNEALLSELKRTLEETARRRWALLPPLLGGIVGGILTQLVALLIAALKSP